MTALLLLALVSATLPTQDGLPSGTRREAETATKVAANNAPLDPQDPEYVRCRRTLQTGSLVKKTKLCHTNREWKIAAENGNREARDIARQASFSQKAE